MKNFMKSMILASAVLTSAQVMADSLIKTHDGTIATCQSKLDVETHAVGAIYRPVKIEQTESTAKITVEFLKCTSEKNQFKFVRDLSLEKRNSKVTDFSTTDLSKKEISMTRSNTSLLAFNGKGNLIDKQVLKRNADGTYSVTINTQAAEYDNSPTGKKSFEIAVQSEFTLVDSTGSLIDTGFENLGSYRLIVK